MIKVYKLSTRLVHGRGLKMFMREEEWEEEEWEEEEWWEEEEEWEEEW